MWGLISIPFFFLFVENFICNKKGVWFDVNIHLSFWSYFTALHKTNAQFFCKLNICLFECFQDAIDLFLGHYVVEQNECVTAPCPLEVYRGWKYFTVSWTAYYFHTQIYCNQIHTECFKMYILTLEMIKHAKFVFKIINICVKTYFVFCTSIVYFLKNIN